MSLPGSHFRRDDDFDSYNVLTPFLRRKVPDTLAGDAHHRLGLRSGWNVDVEDTVDTFDGYVCSENCLGQGDLFGRMDVEAIPLEPVHVLHVQDDVDRALMAGDAALDDIAVLRALWDVDHKRGWFQRDSLAVAFGTDQGLWRGPDAFAEFARHPKSSVFSLDGLLPGALADLAHALVVQRWKAAPGGTFIAFGPNGEFQLTSSAFHCFLEGNRQDYVLVVQFVDGVPAGGDRFMPLTGDVPVKFITSYRKNCNPLFRSLTGIVPD